MSYGRAVIQEIITINPLNYVSIDVNRSVRKQRQTSLVSRSNTLVLSSRPSRSTPPGWLKNSLGFM